MEEATEKESPVIREESLPHSPEPLAARETWRYLVIPTDPMSLTGPTLCHSFYEPGEPPEGYRYENVECLNPAGPLDPLAGEWHGPAFSPKQLEALDIMCKAIAENICKEQRDWLDNEYRKGEEENAK